MDKRGQSRWGFLSSPNFWGGVLGYPFGLFVLKIISFHTFDNSSFGSEIHNRISILPDSCDCLQMYVFLGGVAGYLSFEIGKWIKVRRFSDNVLHFFFGIIFGIAFSIVHFGVLVIAALITR
jgi:hypothetical protein